MIEKDDQMDITDENDEAQDLSVGKPPSQTAAPPLTTAANLPLTAPNSGFSGFSQNSMLGILINKFGFSGIQVLISY